MKIVNEIKDGKDRVLIATNIPELILLKGIINKTRLHLPKNIGTTHDHSRLKNMDKTIGNFIKEYNYKKCNTLKVLDKIYPKNF